MKKNLVFGICLILLVIAGCNLAPKEKKLTKLNIAFQEWIGYGPLYLGYEKGFFKDEGIELFFIDEQLDSARKDAFKAGILDIEAGTLDLLISKRAYDTPIVTVLKLDQSFGADAIATTKEIKNLEDLIGKRIVLSRDDVGETFLSFLFYEKGLDMNKLLIIPKRPEEVTEAFLNNQADVAVTWQPWLSKALERPDTHILISTRDRPGIIIDTLNVREELIKSNPKLIKGLMRAWFRALEYYKNNPLESSQIIAKYYHVSPQEYRKQVDGLQWITYHQQNNPSSDSELINVFNIIAEVKFKNLRIPKKPDASLSIDTTLLKRLYENSQ